MTTSSVEVAQRCSVLVVEDETRLHQLLVRVLPNMGFDAIGAFSAEEAIKIMESRPSDILILDLNLPTMDGMSLFKLVRDRWPETEVIIVTGYGNLETAKQAIHLDVVDFLTKPCHLQELKQALSRARHRLPDAGSHERGATFAIPNALPIGQNSSEATIASAERQLIVDALKRHKGNRTAAAQELGISRRTLYNRIAEYRSRRLWNSRW